MRFRQDVAEKIVKNWTPERVICCFCGEIVFEYKDNVDCVEYGHEPMYQHLKICKEIPVSD